MEFIQSIDDAITYFINDHMHNSFTQAVVPFITHLGIILPHGLQKCLLACLVK